MKSKVTKQSHTPCMYVYTEINHRFSSKDSSSKYEGKYLLFVDG